MMRPRVADEAGFSIIELLVATAILLIVSGVVTNALQQLLAHQQTIWNRTEMHSGVRGATELLQQEIGQAGRITATATLLQAVSAPGGAAPAASSTACDPQNPSTNAVWVQVSSIVGMFANTAPASHVLLTTLDGDRRESIVVAQLDTASPNRILACFGSQHDVNTVVSALGAFGTGVVAPQYPGGSDDTHLKMYGDINDDGNMLFVEYYCDAATTHNLYRLTTAWNATTKPMYDNSMILLSNVYPNDPDASGTARPCFQYQTPPGKTIQGTTFYFVTDVAVTLTVRTERIDPITHDYQKETKSLLNVSPRNVFSLWYLVNQGYTDHLQSTPVTITNLLPN